METLIKTHVADLETEETHKDVGTLWETLKANIIHRTKTIATYIHRQKQQEQKELVETIRLAKQQGYNTQVHMLEAELDTLLQQQYKGAQVRTKLYNDTNKVPTKQFLTIEQNVQTSRTVKEIKDMNGQTHTDSQNISKAFQEYYKQLYTKEPTCTDTQDTFLIHAKKLTDADKDLLDTPITLSDLKTAMKSMTLGKTPGPDGLGVSFYLKFFDLLGPLFLEMVQEAHTKQTLPPSLTLSYITLIPKDNPDKTQLKNYRPISLLNVDYKIISKTITNKLRPHMPKLIHEHQQCAVAKRKIQNHLHFIRDLITYTHEKQTPAAIVSLDQEKAFDRVAHDYLFKTVQAHNFGPYIQTWIKTLYKQPQSQLLVNHALSDPFSLTRSIRQGCSLSPLLYILTLEPLLEKIRQNHTGIALPGGTSATLTAYADDTTFFVKSNKEITYILDTFKLFGKASGSKLNIQKTVTMGLGKWKNKADYPFGISGKSEIKIYGITFTNSPEQTPKKTWETVVTQTRTRLAYYRRLDTTIFTRAYIFNTRILSQLIYTATILNIPDKYLKEINKEITSFIFTGTIRSIKRTTLAQHKHKGGIGLQHIKTKIIALRIGYITDIIKHRDKHPLAHYYLGIRLARHIRPRNNTPHFFGTRHTPFYRTCNLAIQQHADIIGKDTKTAYTTLKLKSATPLHERMKMAYRYNMTDCTSSFKNTHNKFSTATEQEITYRLLFNMTPIKPTLRKCYFCNTNTLNEEHLYAQCPALQTTRDALQDTLEQLLRGDINIHRAITLNTFPKAQYKTQQLIGHLLGTYRHTIWTAFYKKLHQDITTTPQQLHTIWQNKEIKIIQSHLEARS